MHTFLSLDMALIPQETKDYIPNFWLGKFSSDKSRLLIDGYDEQGDLVQPQSLLDAWLQWEDDPQATQELIISTATEYNKEQLFIEFSDPDSIWYEPEDNSEDY